jgi:hypothetical protein
MRKEGGIGPGLGRRRRCEDEPEALLRARLALFLFIECLGAERLVALAVIGVCQSLFDCQGKGKESSAFTQSRAKEGRRDAMVL